MSNTPSKKDVDDLVYALRQKGDDSTYALVVEALAKWGAPPPFVREPLTDGQIRAMCKESWVFESAKQWVRITEQHHGIKGGQHGTDT